MPNTDVYSDPQPPQTHEQPGEQQVESKVNAPTRGRLLLPGLMATALWIGGLRLQAGIGPAEFFPYALPLLGWYLLAALLIALALGYLSRPRAGLRWGLVIVIGLTPAAVLAGVLLSSYGYPDWWYALLGLILAGSGWVMALRLRRVTGRHQWPAVATALLLAGGFVTVNQHLYVSPTLWYAADYAETEATQASGNLSNAAVEKLLFSQPARVEQALAEVGPRELGPSAYFVGFAGYAEEKVFAEEIRFAAEVLDRRYGSGQRSLLLLNDVRDRESTPIASVSTLRSALAGLGKKMNKEQDLLILALSSHGSKNAQLAVSNGDVPLQQLSANDLRGALDHAGIRWRLLIVSACYAGSFIDTLADEHTAIITAAAPDRTSFGCSNDRDLTYFGEAFYRDALPGASSVREAFSEAVELVTERELEINVTPSQPVADFGAQIEEKLAAMERDNVARRSSRIVTSR